MKNLPQKLLFLCAVALLAGLVIYAAGMKHTINRSEMIFVIKTDTVGNVTAASKTLADCNPGVELSSKEYNINVGSYEGI